MMTDNIFIISKNRRATHDYFLVEKVEAGISLQGTEVKSLRSGKMSIAEAFVSVDGQNEIWIYNMKIPPYEFGNLFNHKEDRRRKLLLHKKEIRYLFQQIKTKGLTVIPTMVYLKKGRVKLEIALAKGKKNYDKREGEKEKEVNKKLRHGNYE